MDKIYLKSYPRNGGDSVKTEEGRIWKGVSYRCDPDCKILTYRGCTMSDNFKSFQYFARWCNEQIGFGEIDSTGHKWHIDKDLLIKGNKLYSEQTCVFLPPQINTLLVKTNTTRGCLPIGVSKKRDKFHAYCSNPFVGKRQNLGVHKTPLEAFTAYKEYKEGVMKAYAKLFEGQIDPRAYEALMKYEVEITD